MVLFSSCYHSKDKDKEKEILLETDRAFAKLSADSGAASAFREYLVEDAIQLPANRLPVYGRDAIYTSMSSSELAYTLIWQPQLAEVSKSADMGWTWGNYQMIYFDEDNNKVTSPGKYLNVWLRQPDGTWKVQVDMGNKNPETKSK